jgi:hypothetical protein
LSGRNDGAVGQRCGAAAAGDRFAPRIAARSRYAGEQVGAALDQTLARLTQPRDRLRDVEIGGTRFADQLLEQRVVEPRPPLGQVFAGRGVADRISIGHAQRLAGRGPVIGTDGTRRQRSRGAEQRKGEDAIHGPLDGGSFVTRPCFYCRNL